jgi:hypothetical protein
MRYLIATALLVLSVEAYGKDDGRYAQVNPEIKRWVDGLKDKRGIGCCSTADGFPAEVDWDTAGNRYKVHIEGEWFVVPDEAVIEEPNRLGHAVVWYYKENGRPKIRCFIAGSGA